MTSVAEHPLSVVEQFPCITEREQLQSTAESPVLSLVALLEEVFLGLSVRTPGSFEADLVLSSVKKNTVFSSSFYRKPALGAVHTSLFCKGRR